MFLGKNTTHTHTHTNTHIKELLMRIFWNNKVNSKLSKRELVISILIKIKLINIYSESNHIN